MSHILRIKQMQVFQLLIYFVEVIVMKIIHTKIVR